MPPILRPKQVHGCAVVRLASEQDLAGVEADAVVSSRADVLVGVATADCVPILAASRDGRAVAAIHAGWRGLALGVIEAGIAALRELAREAELVAVVGPRIGACCYEIDAPVVDALRARFDVTAETALRPARPGHHFLDLGLLARLDLERAGLSANAIAVIHDCCTACDSERFHSYRRDGAKAGRLLHFVAPRRVDTARASL